MRVAVNMDELCLGEQLQQHLDAAGMAGRLEQQRASVLVRQLLDEPQQGRLPLRQFTRGHSAKGEIAVIERGPAGNAKLIMKDRPVKQQRANSSSCGSPIPNRTLSSGRVLGSNIPRRQAPAVSVWRNVCGWTA